MKNKVFNTIKKHNLINKGDRVLVALSGGSDSVCLIHILNKLKKKMDFELYACHLNHSIREEADDDCDFVEKLCDELDIKCFTKKVDVKGIAKKDKISEELVGRNERYNFFAEISKKNNINLIATAHNKNDVAETILMHLIRGSGIEGMKGIAYKRDNIIRPLLDAEKKEIEKYCFDNKYKFVVDKTNAQSIYTRNKIRLELIPMLCKGFNPSFVETIVKNSENIKDDADYLNCEAEKLYVKLEKKGKIEIEKLRNLHISMVRRIILIMHKKYFDSDKNMQSVHVESIVKLVMSGKSGKYVNIDNNTKCIVESGWMYFAPNRNEFVGFEYRLELDRKIYISECGFSITLKEWNGDGKKFFFDDVDNIYIRNRRKGDVFYPIGMKGKKKLSDYFTDKKIPLSERDKIPILTCNDDIVWVVEKRRDRRFVEGKKAYGVIIGE